MISPDLINGAFEFGGGFAILLSIRKLHRDKKVQGVSWAHTAFFSAWGYWNLFFYPNLDQWLSFWGGVWLVANNTFWLGQILFYSRRVGISYRDKCKRLRTDGPTPCLCCPNECEG